MRQTYRQTDRQTDRQIDRQTDRQTDRQEREKGDRQTTPEVLFSRSIWYRYKYTDFFYLRLRVRSSLPCPTLPKESAPNDHLPCIALATVELPRSAAAQIVGLSLSVDQTTVDQTTTVAWMTTVDQATAVAWKTTVAWQITVAWTMTVVWQVIGSQSRTNLTSCIKIMFKKLRL